MTNLPQPFAVLVVDDEPDLVSSIGRILRLDGYRVETACSLSELMSRTDLAQFMAILLDRKLSDGMSDSVLPQIRQRAPDSSLIIVTGYADLTSSLLALRYGAEDYLLKPIDPDHLRKRLASIAELRRSALALDEANRKLMQSERLAAIGQMMTVLVHESRNSLQCTQACLETLRMNLADDPESLELVARIQKAQQRLHTLFEEVRQYAAPLKLERGTHDLCEILEETWDNLVWARQGRRVELVPPSNHFVPRCNIDAVRIEQVFRNILENSLAACPDPVRITVDLAEATLSGQPACRLTLIDNGPGLTAEQQAKIFEPFFTTKVSGTGLGMPICKRIIEEHGGEISACNAAPNGTEITIVLPAV